MSIEQDIYDVLRGYASLAALVGTRIFPKAIAQGESLPAVVYQKMETENFNNLEGETLLARNRFQVQVWDKTQDDAETALDAVVAALAASSIPCEGRVAAFDEEAGLHNASVEFDYWA